MKSDKKNSLKAYEQRRARLAFDQSEARARRKGGAVSGKRPPEPPRHSEWQTLTVAERLIDQTESRDGCLEWTGYRLSGGYGRVKVKGVQWQVHRLSWTLHHGPIPDGMVVMHTCDNPPCVAIEHLELGTQADNMADRDQKGRGVVPVRKGNEYTGEHRESTRRTPDAARRGR